VAEHGDEGVDIEAINLAADEVTDARLADSKQFRGLGLGELPSHHGQPPSRQLEISQGVTRMVEQAIRLVLMTRAQTLVPDETALAMTRPRLSTGTFEASEESHRIRGLGTAAVGCAVSVRVSPTRSEADDGLTLTEQGPGTVHEL
jgi:hypothetical protein